MRFRYSDGTASDDCGHADGDPNCVANQVTVTNGPWGGTIVTFSDDFPAGLNDADGQQER